MPPPVHHNHNVFYPAAVSCVMYYTYTSYDEHQRIDDYGPTVIISRGREDGLKFDGENNDDHIIHYLHYNMFGTAV